MGCPGNTAGRIACSGSGRALQLATPTIQNGSSSMGRAVTIQGKDGSFGAYVADAEAEGRSRHRRHPGDLRREPGDARHRRQAGRGGLHRGSAGPVLAHRTGHRHHRQDRCGVGEGVLLLQGVQRRQRRRGYRRHDRLGCAPRATSQVGAVGYCLGGLLAYPDGHADRRGRCPSATTASASTTISAEAGKAKKPVLLHVAEEDGFVSKDSQAKMKAGLTGANFTSCSHTPAATTPSPATAASTTIEDDANGGERPHDRSSSKSHLALGTTGLFGPTPAPVIASSRNLSPG